MFCASGTMSNLLGLAAQCHRGDEIILGNRNHVFQYEGGGASCLLGVAYHTVPTKEDGTNDLEAIRDGKRSSGTAGAGGKGGMSCVRAGFRSVRGVELQADVGDGLLAVAAIRPDDFHFPRTRLVAVETTHNKAYGTPLPQSFMDQVRPVTERDRYTTVSCRNRRTLHPACEVEEALSPSLSAACARSARCAVRTASSSMWMALG